MIPMSVTALPPPTVRLEGERVLINGFIETHPSVVAAIKVAAEPGMPPTSFFIMANDWLRWRRARAPLHELESPTGARLEALTDSTSEVVAIGLSSLSESAVKLFGAKDSKLATALPALSAFLPSWTATSVNTIIAKRGSWSQVSRSPTHLETLFDLFGQGFDPARRERREQERSRLPVDVVSPTS
jgi:hypothetical protein